MRIVQLANLYGPTSGGLRTAVDAVGGGYSAVGHDRVLVVPGEVDGDRRDAHGCTIEIASPRLPGGAGYRAITDLARVKDLLLELAPDRIEVSDKLTLGGLGRWARRQGIPALLWSHERLDAILAPRIPWAGLLRLGADAWNRRLTASFDAVVCSSDFAAAELARIGVTATRVPLGVDLSTFDPMLRTPIAANPGVRRLVVVGRLSAEKRVDVAVDATRDLVARDMPVHLWVVGDGPQRRSLERRARDLPVTFVGHLAHPTRVAALCAQADVAMVTGPYETFGLAVLEALACGTPVVVADSGATRELVVRCPAAVVAPPDGASFARAASVLLAGDETSLRTAARRRAERYSWARTLSRMLAVHERIGRGATPRPVAETGPDDLTEAACA